MKLLTFSTFFTLLFITELRSQSQSETFFESGKEALENNDYISAIGEFTNALSVDPKYGEAYLLRAQAKNDLAKQIGFSDTELCLDLVTALNYGKLEAMDLLEENCISFCFSQKNAFFAPENVFCADFSSSVLYDLPTETDQLVHLVKLNMYNNKIDNISDDIASLVHLVDLDLSSNKLVNINPKISELNYLHWLNLNKNEIVELPAEFGDLSNLKKLYLRSNYITTVPMPITRLKNLEILDLSVNQITDLPIEISNLSNLKELILVGNKIAPSEQKKISALLPNCTIYFDKAN